MNYKPENVKLVVVHDGFEQEITGFDESTYIHSQPPKKNVKSPKSSRCKDTVGWVEREHGEQYNKPKKGEVGY